jgi:hypothetical protein
MVPEWGIQRLRHNFPQFLRNIVISGEETVLKSHKGNPQALQVRRDFATQNENGTTVVLQVDHRPVV